MSEETGEVKLLPPERAVRVTAEIRAVAGANDGPSEATEQLTSDELRDAWPLLDIGERADGLRALGREDAEEFFAALPAQAQAQLLLHLPRGHRRQWLRLLEPDDVVDVIQEAGPEHRELLL